MPKLEFTQYLNLAIRRKWWIILPSILSLIAALAFLTICPKSYRANTLILLEPQSIPDTFVRSTVTETMEGRLRTIQQQIHSRTNLEQIIHEFHLNRQSPNGPIQKFSDGLRPFLAFLGRWSEPRSKEQADDRVLLSKLVDSVREKLEVNMRSGSSSVGRGQSVAFEISFEWNDPEVVAPVTNAIASRFIQENLNAREEMAISTTDFLEKETSTIRVELEAREKELETFKRANMGTLPDELQSNISILNQLGEELLNLERRLESEKQQALLLTSQSQLARAERSTQASTNTAAREHASSSAGSRTGTAMTTDELTSGSLEDLEAELQRMSSLYTEKHPDMVALKRRIETLRKEGPRTSPISSNPQPQESTQHSRLLNAQLAPINANIEAYKRQIQEVEKQIQIYKQRVERTPQVEMELNKITRDYQTVRQRYDNLLSKKLDAKLAEQMEKRKKGEQFRVLDPAVKPPKPFKPNDRKILAMALMAGLGLGCGLAYLRESLDPRFYSPEDVEAFLGVPVMVSLPLADHPDKA